MRKFILFIISIFCVAIISFILYNLYTSSDEPMAKVVNKGKKFGNGTGTAMNLTNTRQRQDFVYPFDNIRDPFQIRQNIAVTPQQQELPTQTGKPLPLKLTGIIWKDGKGIAIIKDSKNETHLVKAGEEIDSVRVIDIKPRMVKVESNNEVIQLELWPAKTGM
jgi:Tfp pilus assembly protein PilP